MYSALWTKNTQPAHILPLLFLLCLLLTSCETSVSSATPTLTTVIAEATEVSGCRFNIGVITSLSGEYEVRARELVQGYEFAQEAINTAGGVLGCRLNLIYRDDASIVTEARRAMQTLVESDGALAVVGSFSSIITLDLVPLASQYRVPLLAHNPTSSLITDLGYRWVFRTTPSSWTSLDQMMRFLAEMPLNSPPKVALLYEDSGYGQDIFVSLISRLKTYGISLVAAIPMPANTSNLKPELDRLKNSGANVLVLAGNSLDDARAIMAQIREARLGFEVYMSPGGAYTSGDFLQSSYASGMIVPLPWIGNIEREDVMSQQSTREFLARFRERYGTSATHRTVNAYTNIYLIKTAVESTLSVPPEGLSQLTEARTDIRDTLREIEIASSLFGPIDFDASGQNMTEVILVQVIEGDLVVISPDEIATGRAVIPAPESGDDQP